jgi:rhodanese-related sulfurtransferase
MNLVNSINLVTSPELQHLLATRNTVLIDVRSETEFAEEHIPGALLFPLDRLTSAQVASYQERCIFYCRSGNRSHQAGEKLLQAGWIKVNHLQGGIQAWKELGYPTTIPKD